MSLIRHQQPVFTKVVPHNANKRFIARSRPGGGPPGPGGPTVLFQDSFTDTNGVLLQNHTPDIDSVGGGWLALSGIADIQSNQASRTIACHYRFDLGVADHKISGEFSVSNANQGPLLRVQDDTHFWYAVYNGSTLELYENNAGYTLRASSAVGAAVVPPYVVEAEATGNNISALGRGVDSLNFTSALFNTETHGGLRMNSAGDTADNYIGEAS